MRYHRLDAIRGIAIILMVIFHLNYSLVYIFENQILNFSEIFWYIVGKFSALLFICIAGISFFFAHEKYEKIIFKKYFKYSLMLGVLAWAISLVSYYVFPQEHIRFWILHFFAVSFLILPIFAKLKYWNILLWISILIYGVYFIPIIESHYWYWLWFLYPWFSSADYYPLFPYFGVLLLGYSFALIFFKWELRNILKSDSNNILLIFLSYSGKKSLFIYMVHQPIIIAVIYCLYYF